MCQLKITSWRILVVMGPSDRTMDDMHIYATEVLYLIDCVII